MTGGGLRVRATNGPLVVNLTAASGTTPAAFSDPARTQSVSLPVTVGAGTQQDLYLVSPGAFSLSVQCSGTEVADSANFRPLTLDLGPGEHPTFEFDVDSLPRPNFPTVIVQSGSNYVVNPNVRLFLVTDVPSGLAENDIVIQKPV